MKLQGTSVLSPGKAPACWQRELARQTARLERSQRVCTWLKPFTQTRPKLRNGPLWGDCLAELTGQGVEPEQPKSEILQPRHDQAGWLDHGYKRKQPHDGIDARSARHRKAPSIRVPASDPPRRKLSLDSIPQPIQLNRQVDQNLLNSLAGQTLPGIYKITSVRSPGRQVAKPPGKSSVAVTANSLPQSDWLRNFARRAWHPLHVMGIDGVPARDEPWAIQLDGETVSPEVLNRWLGPASAKGTRIDRRARVAAKPPWPSGMEPNPSELSPGRASSGNESTRRPLPVAGWTGEVESEWVSSEPIAPPAVAPSLPHLLPPQIVNQPAPALATMIARQASRREVTQAEDDLAGLATNIKRILDEEARRHGIDV